MQIIKSAVHEVKAMLNEARIHLSTDFKVEYSHHYGVENFRKTGAVIIECINREYCKKLLVQLPVQEHPSHYHARKEETFQVLLAPGHSPGSICLYWPDKRVLVTGDVVFNQGIGRTDLPGGNGKLLKESIKKLAALEVEYLLPGHGEIVAGKKSVDANFNIIETQWFGYLA